MIGSAASCWSVSRLCRNVAPPSGVLWTLNLHHPHVTFLPLLSPQTEVSHFFGYVYFRQVKDVSVKRGYFQKVSHTWTPVANSRNDTRYIAVWMWSCDVSLTPVVMWRCLSVSGADIQVAVCSPVPLAAADHRPRVLWETGALPGSRWWGHQYVLPEQSEPVEKLHFLAMMQLYELLGVN